MLVIGESPAATHEIVSSVMRNDVDGKKQQPLNCESRAATYAKKPQPLNCEAIPVFLIAWWF